MRDSYVYVPGMSVSKDRADCFFFFGMHCAYVAHSNPKRAASVSWEDTSILCRGSHMYIVFFIVLQQRHRNYNEAQHARTSIRCSKRARAGRGDGVVCPPQRQFPQQQQCHLLYAHHTKQQNSCLFTASVLSHIAAYSPTERDIYTHANRQYSACTRVPGTVV